MSFGPDESANALFKRCRAGNVSFHWDMLNSDRSRRKEVFQFNEVVHASADPKDLQEMQHDLLLAFLQKMSHANILVVHISTGNSLVSTLAQSGEDQNPLVVDLDKRGRLRCVSVGSLAQVYAALDLLHYTVDQESVSPGGASEAAPSHTLLLLDHIEPLLSSAPAPAPAPVGKAANSSAACAEHTFTPADIFVKLADLVDAQAVLAFWIHCLPGTGTGTASPASTAASVSAVPVDVKALGAGLTIKRHLFYQPGRDAV